jgi:hypothetical protein
MEDITELDLIKEFIKLTDKPLRSNELTVRRFMEYADVERNRARYVLAKYEEMGLLKMRKVVINGAALNAYSPAKGTWKDLVESMKKE